MLQVYSSVLHEKIINQILMIVALYVEKFRRETGKNPELNGRFAVPQSIYPADTYAHITAIHNVIKASPEAGISEVEFKTDENGIQVICYGVSVAKTLPFKIGEPTGDSIQAKFDAKLAEVKAGPRGIFENMDKESNGKVV